MSDYQWDPKYALGIPTIDAQHKDLFELIDRLIEANHNWTSKDIIESILTDLMRYTSQHFSEEEALLADIHSPLLKEQQTQHAIFINRLDQLFKHLESGKKLLATMEATAFLKEWLLKHVLLIDSKYAKELQVHQS